MALSHLISSHDEDIHHIFHLVGLTVPYPIKGLQQHGIAREDGLIGIPLLMNSLIAPTHIGMIHQVVVEQREVVIGLYTDGLRHDTFGILAIEVIGQEHEDGTDTLTAQRQHIAYRIVECVWLTVIGEVLQGLVHLLEQFF